MKPFNELTDEEVASFIAEKMGWKQDSVIGCWTPPIGDDWFGIMGVDNDGSWNWNPMHSLDQCWIFEEWILKQDISYWDTYCLTLANIVGKDELFVHATASQRCQAFYETMGGIEG